MLRGVTGGRAQLPVCLGVRPSQPPPLYITMFILVSIWSYCVEHTFVSVPRQRARSAPQQSRSVECVTYP
jgi:hypothetical protein